jgi:hypothetical protein
MDVSQLKQYVDDRPEQGVFRVHRAVFSDPELFDLEQRYIFERTWQFLTLDSEIARPNDFVTAWIGRTPVLITRDAQGDVRALPTWQAQGIGCAGRSVQCEVSRVRVPRLGLRRGRRNVHQGRQGVLRGRIRRREPRPAADRARGALQGLIFGSLSPAVPRSSSSSGNCASSSMLRWSRVAGNGVRPGAGGLQLWRQLEAADG